MSDSNAKVRVTSGGIGLCSALFLLFLTLKLCGVSEVAGWSWWWVFAPLWGPWVLILGALTVVGIVLLVVALVAR